MIGHDVVDIATAFWNGSIGTRTALVSGTLVRWVPLALIGVGLSIAFRAGVFNIGGEGQFMAGAIGATVAALAMPRLPPIIAITMALVASAVAGAFWAGIAAVLRARFGVLEVISTIMLNFVAANLASYLVRGPLQEPTHIYPQTTTITPGERLPLLVPDSRLHIGVIFAAVICVVAWWFINRTAAGFRLRAVGASPSASRSAGRIDVDRVASLAMMISGALAGFAGGVEMSGVTYALYENLSPGYGFSAIAVAILAGLDPLAVALTAFVFAAIETGALGMQRDAGVPAVVSTAAEAVVILVVVAWRREQLPWRWPSRFFEKPAPQ
jgi:general nucleoside transport system permease protein